MKPDTDKPETPAAKPESTADSKPDAKPDAKPTAGDDLKTMPLADLEKKLASSPDGLTQTEAASRLTKDGPNEIVEKK